MCILDKPKEYRLPQAARNNHNNSEANLDFWISSETIYLYNLWEDAYMKMKKNISHT